MNRRKLKNRGTACCFRKESVFLSCAKYRKHNFVSSGYCWETVSGVFIPSYGNKFNDGISFAVNQIIPILDTLDMAANAPTTDENYKKGVVMTLDKAAKALEALHVEEIEALGKPFDPNFMNAVQQIPAPDGQESGTVVTVYQKGYKLGDKIVRHATVVVAE